MGKGLPSYFLPVSLTAALAGAVGLRLSLGLTAARPEAQVSRATLNQPGQQAGSASTMDGEPAHTDPVESPTAGHDDPTDESERAVTSQKAGTRTLPFASDLGEIAISGAVTDDVAVLTQLDTLRETIARVEGEGHRIGFEIRNMQNGRAIAYGANKQFYSASSIKAPFVASLYEEMVDAGSVSADEVLELAQATIVQSDNESYDVLGRQYGRRFFVDWAVRAGAFKPDSDCYHELLVSHCAMLSPWQLDRMWQAIYAYLQRDSEGARTLAGFLERCEESPLRDGLSQATKTLCKAGWYPLDEGPKYASTVDAGIVAVDGQDYLVVIMTDYPADLERLSQLAPGIFSAADALQ